MTDRCRPAAPTRAFAQALTPTGAAIAAAVLAGMLGAAAPALASMGDQFLCYGRSGDDLGTVSLDPFDPTLATSAFGNLARVAEAPAIGGDPLWDATTTFEGPLARFVASGNVGVLTLDGEASPCVFVPGEPAVPDSAEINASFTLMPDGLVAELPRFRDDTAIQFGTDVDALVAVLQDLFEVAPTVAQNPECGAGPVTAYGFQGMTINAQDGAFAGWVLDAPTGGVAGFRRIDIGTPRTALPADALELFAGSTLGTEFTLDGIGGLFASDEAAAPVDLLYAGVTCFFR